MPSHRHSRYAAAALRRVLAGGDLGAIVFPSGASAGATFTTTLPAGALISFGFAQNSNVANWLNANSSNQLSTNPHGFFALEAANPDDYDHFLRNLGEFRVEDLDGGGDQDFNDIIFTVEVLAS